MKTPPRMRLVIPCLVLTIAGASCSREDPRVNSNPHPEQAVAEKTKSPRADQPAQPAAASGTDSTGRPADSSGGTTGPRAGDSAASDPQAPQPATK